MKLSRRELVAAGAGAALGLAGCNRIASQARRFAEVRTSPLQRSDVPDVALLNRFAFGPTAVEVDMLRSQGLDAWFEAQLGPDDREPAPLELMVSRLDTEHFSSWELRDLPATAVSTQLQQKALLMAVYSPWQLRERMVEFWTDHFSIYAQKGLASFRKPLDERNVIRKHALGRFPDMVKASAHSTAMLVYLDQQNSTSAHPNENYARELLELHTLGVDGGYTQDDVMEVARCLTGWTEQRGFLKHKGEFKFESTLHDPGSKRVLGRTISAGGGKEDGDRVLDLVATHPSTARHISRKLCRYFLGDAGPTAEATVAEAFMRTGGDIKAMLRALFAAYRGISVRPQVRRPFEYMVATLRAIGADTDGGHPILEHLTRMGHARYEWPMPDGYPIKDDAWTGSMVGRWRFVHDLLAGHIGGTRVDLGHQKALRETTDTVELVTFCPAGTPAHAEVSALSAALPELQQAGLALCAPVSQWK